jgi:SAM-dependent methyltransferase
MHLQAYEFVARYATEAAVDVLEIGSHDVNGSVRPLFPGARRFHGIDLVAGPGVDEVADAADWHDPAAFDLVVTTEVLEHAPRWEALVANAWEARRAGGMLVVTCATDPRPPHSAIDGWAVRPGEHYQNVDPDALLALVASLGSRCWTIEVHHDRGDLYLAAK